MITIVATRDAPKITPTTRPAKPPFIISTACPGVSDYASQGRESTPERFPQLEAQPCQNDTPPQSPINHPKAAQTIDTTRHWLAIFHCWLARHASPLGQRPGQWLGCGSIPSRTSSRAVLSVGGYTAFMTDTSSTRIEGLRYEPCQYCPPDDCWGELERKLRG